MKTSLQWLRTYLPDAPDAHTLGERLTLAGLPTETFETYEGDDVFDVEVTSNRSDCLSHVGIARELAALLKLPAVEPPVEVPGGIPAGPGPTLISLDDPDACPVYSAIILRGVRVGPSPAWLQRHLASVGLRPISNLVDITNFVLLEMGQPLHVFDLAQLATRSGRPEIVVRRARAGEELVSLDGHTRKLDPGMLVIADAEKPAALAGIMGGKPSEVTHATTDVLLEAALFDPLVVRRTSRRLALRSDSSYRYERGLDPTLVRRAAMRATRLILELAGGRVDGGIARVGAPEPSPRKLSLRMGRLARVLGYEIALDDAVDALRRLRLSPVVESDPSRADSAGAVVRVTVPPDRLDLNIEVDLVEEVARVTGYEHIPQRDAIEIRLTPPEPWARPMQLIGDVLVGSGYFEAITFSFVSDQLAGDFLSGSASAQPRAEPATRKADARLRPSLLPGLIESLRHNESVGNGAVRLYEIGSTFVGDETGAIVETRRVALAGGTDLHDVRGVVEALLARLDSRRAVSIVPARAVGYDLAAVIHWGGLPVGTLGLVARSVTEKLGLRHAPVAAELDLAPLIAHARPVPSLTPLPRFPAVERDVSLLVGDAVSYDGIVSVLSGLQLPLLERVDHVGTYRGKPLEKGTKSVTMRLAFRAADRSLTSQEADTAVTRFVDAAKSALGAALRV